MKIWRRACFALTFFCSIIFANQMKWTDVEWRTYAFHCTCLNYETCGVFRWSLILVSYRGLTQKFFAADLVSFCQIQNLVCMGILAFDLFKWWITLKTILCATQPEKKLNCARRVRIPIFSLNLLRFLAKHNTYGKLVLDKGCIFLFCIRSLF
jgi:hypothetical protein